MYMYDLSDFATIHSDTFFSDIKNVFFTINHTFKSEDSTTKTDLNFNRIVYIIYLPLSASVLSFCFQQIQIKQNEVSYIEYILYTFATNCCNEESLVSGKSNEYLIHLQVEHISSRTRCQFISYWYHMSDNNVNLIRL